MTSRGGSAAPAMISVDAQFNAGYGAVGWRRTRVLRLGYPLWNLLTDDERLAIVGHEIAHDVNGDLRHGAVVRTAMSSLREWYLILRPSTLFTRRRRAYVRRGSGSLVMLAEYLALLMLAPISAAVLSLSGLLAYIGSRSGQHAEYWADDAAARVAGTDASVRALEKTMLAESCAFALRQAVMAGALDLWAAQRAYLADLPASELERLRRRARVRRQRIDASHPPSHLRAQLLAQSPRRAGEIQPDDKSWARIATELAPAANITAAALRDALPAPEPAARRASR